jgi:hypothetical protein
MWVENSKGSEDLPVVADIDAVAVTSGAAVEEANRAGRDR